MSPELGFFLFLALLWGPTALWLVFRTIRGNRGRLPRPFDRSQLAPEQLDAPVGSDGFWACGTCRSLNRSGANRCYRCRMAKGSAGRKAPGEPPVGPGVPVMAEVIARPSGELPVGPGVPVMAEVIGRPSGELPVGPGVPVMAEVIGRPSGEPPVATTVALATRGNGPPAPDLLLGASERTSSAAPPEAPADVLVCPFLGFRDDPATRNDFPDPANYCHATSARDATAVASARRFIAGMAGSGRPQPIAAEHQRSWCLAAAHQRCARYPARRGGRDEPTVGREGVPSA